ncbi:acetyl-CoA carboxylase carboxyltransferase subunit alpha [Monoraphidium neglectum]|uniref:Acetyl-CoA carboxylase carboxyltransferase subunit alpha n=1 Tax=Monoraphidium neglectum TaxID=145388 RepID=A0A0D2LNP6_9CHLO|nr:acetyl-CoA carboxylase carboxyltransferase subunit alpha [Monoraphidium neglectum]KIY93424.1 acetyl-CoA carboxylase carboxyltransferase subunit alpha [Monoraphidium neglectum]|eukprot:XP_013892444.1 acetyl-CoA carboxylase carboxyltransferase subunit alpha [Monoraphidium neglectum]
MLHQRAAHRPCGTAPSRRINTQLRALGQAGKGGKDLQERGKAWLSTILTRFGPATDRATNITTLEFEKPLLELDKRIKEVRKVAEENGVDVSASIAELETRARQGSSVRLDGRALTSMSMACSS